MPYRHNAKADALGVDRCFALLRHDVCYDYPCFVILSEAKDLMIVSVGAGLVPALCLRLFCFGHPQGVPLQALFVAVVFYVRARVFKLRPCFRGGATK